MPLTSKFFHMSTFIFLIAAELLIWTGSPPYSLSYRPYSVGDLGAVKMWAGSGAQAVQRLYSFRGNAKMEDRQG